MKRFVKRIWTAVKGIVAPPRVVWPKGRAVIKKSIAVAALCAAVAAVTAVMDVGIAGLLHIPLMF